MNRKGVTCKQVYSAGAFQQLSWFSVANKARDFSQGDAAQLSNSIQFQWCPLQKAQAKHTFSGSCPSPAARNAKRASFCQVQVTRGGKLKARKGVNVPDIAARPTCGLRTERKQILGHFSRAVFFGYLHSLKMEGFLEDLANVIGGPPTPLPRKVRDLLSFTGVMERGFTV